MSEELPDEPDERSTDPAQQAREKADQFRMHAELAAAFEGCRKFDAALDPTLDVTIARDIQRAMAKLDKARLADGPIIPDDDAADARSLLDNAHKLSTSDYHVHRRPGEVMIVRWLTGEQVDTFYTRLQAHFDAAMNAFKEDEHQARAWTQDPKITAYLAALDKIEIRMADRYLRSLLRQHNLTVLSTQTADEINIAYLCDHLMGVPIPELVGRASSPPDEPTEQDLAWFFKLFSLRDFADGIERMCLFAYLQKSNEAW